MRYVSILLSLLFYIYAVAGVFLGENDPIYFKDLQTSMLSLFRIVTLEDWTDIMYINMFDCENYGYGDNIDLCTNSTAFYSLSVTYFVTIILIWYYDFFKPFYWSCNEWYGRS